MNETKITATPFLYWAGGKMQLLDNIREYYPFENGEVNQYIEPFVGGGSVLFDVLSNYKLDKVTISDTNLQLMHTYIAVRDFVNELLALLEQYETEYLPLNKEEGKIYYLQKRDMFNELITEIGNNFFMPKRILVKEAALMIFLNKTCFNGLYRVNKKGLFNTSYGTYEKNRVIYNKDNLLSCSKLLQGVNILCADYKIFDFIITSSESEYKNTFIYFDPPYRPLKKSKDFQASDFNKYGKDKFDDDSQKELADFFKTLDSRGVKLLLSNSNPKNSDSSDTFFEYLYEGYNIEEVYASRWINSKGDKRGKISELLISNIKKNKIAEPIDFIAQ